MDCKYCLLCSTTLPVSLSESPALVTLIKRMQNPQTSCAVPCAARWLCQSQLGLHFASEFLSHVKEWQDHAANQQLPQNLTMNMTSHGLQLRSRHCLMAPRFRTAKQLDDSAVEELCRIPGIVFVMASYKYTLIKAFCSGSQQLSLQLHTQHLPNTFQQPLHTS
jgi:hypothetical protein